MRETRSDTELAGFELDVVGRDVTVRFVPRSLVVAGYTARERSDAQRHIDELSKIGVAPPRSVPSFYLMPNHLLTLRRSIEVDGPNTTGEVEPVLLCTGGVWYLTVGSDHTDRDLERVDIGSSKRACPKVISRRVVHWDSLGDAWDGLWLRSWTGPDTGPYQEGQLSSLMKGGHVLDELSSRIDIDKEGLVVFLGTVPLAVDEFRPASYFRAELGADGSEPLVWCSYEVARRSAS